MTLWARKSDFKSAFELLNVNTNWDVELKEESEIVRFVITPETSVVIDVENFVSSHAVSQMTGCGSQSVEMNFEKDPKFIVTVERSKLPEDYRD
jgi:hypothetical protein